MPPKYEYKTVALGGKEVYQKDEPATMEVSAPEAVVMKADAPDAFGPSSCGLGPHATGTQDAKHLCKASFISATIYYPTEFDGLPSRLPSVVIVGGQGCGEQAMAAWAPFYSSHGIVAMTIGTPVPWLDSPAARCRALLDASLALQSEHGREGSVLQGRLDVERRAVQGYSLGGGGAQMAGLSDQTLKCVIALAPNEGETSPPAERLSFPSEEELRKTTVPVLIICGEKDTYDADPKTQAWPQYRQTKAPKLIVEVKGGDHYVANGPAGGAKEDLERGVDDFMLCNFISANVCMMCNPCYPGAWCVPFSGCGTLNGSSGHTGHNTNAQRGAIGGIALAWLRLFLLGDESVRSQLALRPDIASGFECSGVAVAP